MYVDAQTVEGGSVWGGIERIFFLCVCLASFLSCDMPLFFFSSFWLLLLRLGLCWALCGCGPGSGGGGEARLGLGLPCGLVLVFGVLRFGFLLFAGVRVSRGLLVVR